MEIDKTLIITETDDLNTMRDKIHKNAINKGWTDHERSIDEFCALFHSEVSEFFEEFRLPEPKALYFDTTHYNISILDKNGMHKADEAEKIDNILSMEYKWNNFEEIAKYKPLGYGIELADLVIRLLDFFGEKCIDLSKIKNICCIEEDEYSNDIFSQVMSLHRHITEIGFNPYYENYSSDIITEINILFNIVFVFEDLHDFDLNEMIRIKHKYNLTRPVKHGKRF